MQFRHGARAHGFQRSRATCRSICLTILAAGLTLGGCPEPSRNNFPTNVIDVDRIASDETLTPQERRDRLASMGLSASAINAAMREEPLANQFGGTLRSAFVKVVDGFFQNLTPDEVQIYADEATAVDSDVNADLSDLQAQSIQDFFRDQDIDDSAELAEFLEDPAQAALVPDAISDGVLTRLFVDFDPELLRERL